MDFPEELEVLTDRFEDAMAAHCKRSGMDFTTFDNMLDQKLQEIATAHSPPSDDDYDGQVAAFRKHIGENAWLSYAIDKNVHRHVAKFVLAKRLEAVAAGFAVLKEECRPFFDLFPEADLDKVATTFIAKLEAQA